MQKKFKGRVTWHLGDKRGDGSFQLSEKGERVMDIDVIHTARDWFACGKYSARELRQLAELFSQAANQLEG